MGEIDKLIAELRRNHLCITYGDNCRICDEPNYKTCRRRQELCKEAADMLSRYASAGLTPQEVLELKARMEGLEK